ncbi:MAG: tRNA pseudouridine(55) synthase TruB [Desulfobacterales bacterium]|jgi:tRNA pseudouridine55 synthase|nr:tRNA pseudouridine(55) synthase TruB [Desulfobacterales bacterium]
MHNSISGLLIVDKPAGISSAKVVARVKALLKAKKVGHTGTLDPFATGVLVCCINRATKLARFFLRGNKKYEAVLRLGIETDTQDPTGNITRVCNPGKFSEETIKSVFKRYEGTLTQVPPVYSALKYKGIPLYKLARRDEPVQKPARKISVIDLEIRDIQLPTIRFEVSCSAGTYIRTLCADIGAALGCGGHLKTLRRIESSGFTIKQAITLEELEDLARTNQSSGRIIGMSDALKHFPEHTADHMLEQKIKHGQILTKNDIVSETVNPSGGFMKIVDAEKQLIAVLKHAGDRDKYDYVCVLNN